MDRREAGRASCSELMQPNTAHGSRKKFYCVHINAAVAGSLQTTFCIQLTHYWFDASILITEWHISYRFPLFYHYLFSFYVSRRIKYAILISFYWHSSIQTAAKNKNWDTRLKMKMRSAWEEQMTPTPSKKFESRWDCIRPSAAMDTLRSNEAGTIITPTK